jgi:hypothetical protein
LLQLKQQYQNDLGLLNYLTGETDTTFVKLKKPEIQLLNIIKEDKNIFFKTFEIDSLKLQNQKSLIKDLIKIKLLSQMNAQVSAAASSKKMSSSSFSQYVMSIADLYDMAVRNGFHMPK